MSSIKLGDSSRETISFVYIINDLSGAVGECST